MLFVSLLLVTWSRVLIDLRTTRLVGSLLLGVAVFVVWIGPDLLWPEYRYHWLFQNAITGTVHGSTAEAVRKSTVFLFFRVAGSVILVPIIEEIFWRAWLMRYLVSRDFLSVPLGTYAAPSFWISALLFASEHGSYWDVGLLAGVGYNWWIVRTKSLGDCIFAHAVTNACLAVYVLSAGKWEYWL